MSSGMMSPRALIASNRHCSRPFHPFPARCSRVPMRLGACWSSWMGSGRARWRLSPSEVIPRWTWKPRRPPLLWVCCEKQNGGRILVLHLLGLPGATCSPPSSAVWWMYARARHPKAAFGTASSDMQHRTACSGLVPTAVLPARPPADQRGRLGCQEHSRPCDAAWAALLPALRIGASACDM